MKRSATFSEECSARNADSSLENDPTVRPIQAPRELELQCRTIDASDVDNVLAAQWEAIRSRNGSLGSPFFSAEFTRAVARVRDDCEVAVVESKGSPLAFLPYHRQGNTLFPLARMINDAHGIISACDTEINWKWLLGELGASGYEFHALFSQPSEVEDYAFGWTRTFLCDLDEPEEGYIQWLEKTRKTIYKQRRKTKKLIKDVGPLRLEYACEDLSVLERLMDLKSQQYVKTKIFDIFSVSWIRDLMRNLIETDSPLKGRLSVLYAGDQLVAGHMGMQEDDLLHYWFPVYDTAFSFASPGTALFLEIVREAKSNGLSKIDFGYGELPYKWVLNNVIDVVPHGAICMSRTGWHGRRLRGNIVRRIKSLPGKEISKRVLRKVHPQFGGNHYQ